MDSKTKDALKTGLAAVGAVTVVTTAPVLTAGVAIGMLLTNPDKVKAAAEKVSAKLKDFNKEMEEAVHKEEYEEDSDIDEELQKFFDELDQTEAAAEALEAEKNETGEDPCYESEDE